MLNEDGIRGLNREELIAQCCLLQRSLRQSAENNKKGNNRFSVLVRGREGSSLASERPRQDGEEVQFFHTTHGLSIDSTASHGSGKPTPRYVWKESDVNTIPRDSQNGCDFSPGPDDASFFSGFSTNSAPTDVISSALPEPIPVAPGVSLPVNPSTDALVASTASYRGPAARLTSTVRLLKNPEGKKYINHYLLMSEIGRGSCGKVQLAFDEEQKRLVAIKQVNRADSKTRIGGPNNAQKQYSALLREIAVMKKVRHKNVVPLYEVIDDPSAKRLYLVMMYVEKGPIGNIQCHADPEKPVCSSIPAATLAIFAGQILTGLEYLHNRGIIHRDIKPENILVDRNDQAYLADFGVSEMFEQKNREALEQLMQESMAASRTCLREGNPPTIQGTKGTMLFIAPELWTGNLTFGKPVDMWAMGVTLYILLTGKLPFCTIEDITDTQNPIIPTEYGAKWENLLRGLLHRDPKRRLTVRAARAIVKEMIATKSDDEEPNDTRSDISLTLEDIENAVTVAARKKDQDDMAWLFELGQDGVGPEPSPAKRRSLHSELSEEEVGIDYGLPCVMPGGVESTARLATRKPGSPKVNGNAVHRLRAVAATRSGAEFVGGTASTGGNGMADQFRRSSGCSALESWNTGDGTFAGSPWGPSHTGKPPHPIMSPIGDALHMDIITASDDPDIPPSIQRLEVVERVRSTGRFRSFLQDALTFSQSTKVRPK